MKSNDWIDLEQAAGRLSVTTEEVGCMVREGILGVLIDREGGLFVQAGEIDCLVEVFRPSCAAIRGFHQRSERRGAKRTATSHNRS